MTIPWLAEVIYRTAYLILRRDRTDEVSGVRRSVVAAMVCIVAAVAVVPVA